MRTRSGRWLGHRAAGVAALLVALTPAQAGPDDPIGAWIHERAADYDAYFEARQSGQPAPSVDQLWRGRPISLGLKGFVAPTSLAPLIRDVQQGVVNISTVNTQPTATAGNGAADPGSTQSLGSGMLIDADGFVVTNNHVVDRAEQIRVKLGDGREFLAEVIGRDASTDVALLRLVGDTRDLPFVYFGNSDLLEVGDWVIAIGNPFGLDHSVAQGIISAKERVIGVGDLDDFLQTDALINPGNSGGPLFNMRGEVIGVNTAIVTKGQGIGFAVPINLVKDLLPNLRANGHLARGWLGLSISEDRDASGGSGAVVKEVYAASPSTAAGIHAGDRVLEVKGRPVETYSQLLRQISLLPPGAEVTLTIERGGKKQERVVTLGERPPADQLEVVPMTEPGPLGLIVRALTPDLAAPEKLDPFSAIFVNGVLPGSDGERAGIHSGDVVVEVNKRKVTDLDSFRAAVSHTPEGHPTLLKVQRGGQSKLIAVGAE